MRNLDMFNGDNKFSVVTNLCKIKHSHVSATFLLFCNTINIGYIIQTSYFKNMLLAFVKSGNISKTFLSNHEIIIVFDQILMT